MAAKHLGVSLLERAERLVPAAFVDARFEVVCLRKTIEVLRVDRTSELQTQKRHCMMLIAVCFYFLEFLARAFLQFSLCAVVKNFKCHSMIKSLFSSVCARKLPLSISKRKCARRLF